MTNLIIKERLSLRKDSVVKCNIRLKWSTKIPASNQSHIYSHLEIRVSCEVQQAEHEQF